MISATNTTAELAQLSLCSVTDADTVAENDEAAAADAEMLSQIYPGYETDPWFATASHTPSLYIKGCTTRAMQPAKDTARPYCRSSRGRQAHQNDSLHAMQK